MSSGPKVAHLTTSDISLRFLLLPQLLASNCRGEAIAISAPGPHVEELNRLGIRHVGLPSSTRSMNILADIRTAFELWTILRHERPDVLHTHNPKPGFYGRIVGRLAGVPVVVNTVHGLYATPDDTLPRRLGVYTMEAFAARFSTAELVQSKEDFDLLTRWRISPPRRCTHIGNGVDLFRFRPLPITETERVQLRSSFGFAPSDVVVGFIGRLVREKGLPELFEVARHLQGRARFLVVGDYDPEKTDSLHKPDLDSASRDGVIFAGFRSDTDRLYGAIDIVLLPSHREGMPRVAMEAAACGLPVVASDIRGCREVVDSERTGLLFPMGDAGAIAAALARLVADPDERRAMGVAARCRAEEQYDERAIVDRVLASYQGGAVGRHKEVDKNRHPSYGWAKRLLDLTVASVATVCLLPILALVWVIVRLSLGRPVFFVQERPGLHGASFRLHKFRTMDTETGKPGTGLSDQERIRGVGKWLRATSLDELPQLFDVLAGNMSLVGPRPLLVEYLDRYTPAQTRRHEVKPGITGWAQINGRNDQTWDQRLLMDVWYVDNWSLRLDLRILLLTVRRVLERQGISFPGEATMPEFLGLKGP